MSESNSVWYQGIIGHKMNGYPVMGVLPYVADDKTIIILVDMADNGKFVTARLYAHQFTDGLLPREWDAGEYFHYDHDSYDSKKQIAITSLIVRAVSYRSTLD